MEKLKYVVPTIEYEKEAIDFINEFYEYNSEINGTGGLQRFLDNYPGWLLKLKEDENRIPNEEKVPAVTYFLVRESDNKIVGMINIRLALNERLRKYAGHIGYCIRPTERRKGYNKINLYLGLKVCQQHNIKEVFMDCDSDNIASSKTMQALGGVMTREYFDDEFSKCMVQDYIFDVDKCLESTRDVYEPLVCAQKIK